MNHNILEIYAYKVKVGEIKTPFSNLPKNALDKYLSDWAQTRHINKNGLTIKQIGEK